jgi:hypothetical protein
MDEQNDSDDYDDADHFGARAESPDGAEYVF